MNASFLSIRVTSTVSPSASDNMVESSRPPKPAPRTTMRPDIRAILTHRHSRRSPKRQRPRPQGQHAGPSELRLRDFRDEPVGDGLEVLAVTADPPDALRKLTRRLSGRW